MIHPTTDEKVKVPAGRNKVNLAIYYVIGLGITLFNFIPWSLNRHPSNPSGMQPNVHVLHFLSYCGGLALPLIFEYLLDVVFAFFSPDINDRKFGQGLLLLSLLMPGALALRKVTLIFTLAFVSFCQAMACVAIYGKLQVYGTRWTFKNTIPITIMFVIAQISLCLGVAHAKVDALGRARIANQYIYFSFLLYLICFISQVTCAEKYGYQFWRKYRQGRAIFSDFEADDYVCLILQFIMALYYFIAFVFLLTYNRNPVTLQQYVSGLLLRHIILNLTASILPGRMIKRDLSKLKQEMQTKETFIRYISHEIRSPLSTTSMGLDYLINKLTDGTISLAEVLEVVNDSKSTCELATQTLNDLLMFDKIQNNMLDISPTEVDAYGFINSSVNLFKLQAASSNISLDVVCARIETDVLDEEAQDDELQAIVRIDNYKMDQVLRNLLGNALKFTPRDGQVVVKVSIQNHFSTNSHTDHGTHTAAGDKNEKVIVPQVRAQVDGVTTKVIRVAVSDTGVGVSRENLPRMFGQYVQFDAEKLQGGKGSGLGLWLSKAIVEIHGGKVGASSDGLGKGCTTWYELPCTLVPVLSASTSVRSKSEMPLDIAVSPQVTEISIDNSGDQTDQLCALHEITEIKLPHTNMFTRSTSRHMDYQIHPIASESDDVLDHLEAAPPRTMLQPGLVRGSQSSLFKASVKASAKASSRRQKMGGLKVLLVDDSAIARKMVERALTNIQCQCQQACDGREAVNMVEHNMSAGARPFDVILMDYYMPVMNGPEAIAGIRGLGFKGIIIAVTGVNTDEEFAALYSAGQIERIMVKPFRVDTFQSIVQEIHTANKHNKDSNNHNS